jgi:hypothetical protein
MPSAIVIKQIPGKPGQVYYPLEKISVEIPKPSDDQVAPNMLIGNMIFH